MESKSDTNSNSCKSYKKIRRIHNAIENYMPIEVIKNLLQIEGDIDYEISEGRGIERNLLSSHSYFQNPTYFDLLLEFGADFVKKNEKGRTIVHEHIKFHSRKEDLLCLLGNFKNDFINVILSAHVKYNVTANPHDENGISHFHVACITNNAQVVEFFLKNGLDVNQTVNADSPIFPLDSPLHLVAKYASTESMEIILKYGANVRVKNADGLTPIHLLVQICKLGLKLLSPYEAALSILLKFSINDVNNFETVDEFGFCNLHAASILADELLVENILVNTINVNQAVNSDSPICSGYTALHFAAYSKVEIFRLLVEKGADIGVKNGRGMTPIDMLLQKYGASEVYSILLSKSEWRNIVLSDGKTKLIDVVSTMGTADEFIVFLNSNASVMTLHVPFDSSLWPGFTLLHLAVIFTMETRYLHFGSRIQYGFYDDTKIIECLKRGTDMTVSDAKGSTALHVAFYLGKCRVVECLLDHHDKAVNPIDADNLSHFHIACAAHHRQTVERLLSAGVEVNRPVLKAFDWVAEQGFSEIHLILTRCTDPKTDFMRFFICPGSTALHINVASGDAEITKLLLKHGADVHASDANGFTPVHRLLTSKSALSLRYITDLLLSDKNLKNCVANGGISHLHVACYFGHTMAIEKLLKSGTDINAAITYKGKSKKLFYNDNYDRYGDPDEPLNFLCDFQEYTPLHFAMQKANGRSIIWLLIEAGADFARKASDGSCFLNHLSSDSLFQPYNPMLLVLQESNVMQEYFEKKFGWTKLHFACCGFDVATVKKLIRQGANVNAKIYSDCPVWKGYTPLHVTAAMAFRDYDKRNVSDSLKKIVHLLMKSGADLTLVDDNRDTPLHLHSLYANPFLNFLFENIKDHNINSTNSQGISLFHIACATQNKGVVEKFLKHGVNVNQATSYDADNRCPGGTPLHAAICYFKCNEPSKRFTFSIGFSSHPFLRIVDKLIQNGANVNAADVYGETPLFLVMKLKKFRRPMIQKLISNGADVHATNAYGNTPFELLIKQEDATWEEIELFLKAGCHFNTFNPITQVGYIAELCYHDITMNSEIRLKVEDHPQLTEINDAGRTAIHNIVSIKSSSETCTYGMIELLITRGCDIDHQDNEGKTALHLAMNMKNIGGIRGLLRNGADVNLNNNDGKTFIAYVCESSNNTNFWPDSREVMVAFAIHIYKLEYCQLHVNKQNKRFETEALKKYPLQNSEFLNFHFEIENTKNIKIDETSLSLYEFLTDRYMDVVYMTMTKEERQGVDRYFQNISKHNFLQIDCLLKLKYRQVTQRVKLIDPALESFNTLIKYKLPELCCRNILRFLNNEDLKHLIALTA